MLRGVGDDRSVQPKAADRSTRGELRSGTGRGAAERFVSQTLSPVQTGTVRGGGGFTSGPIKKRLLSTGSYKNKFCNH